MPNFNRNCRVAMDFFLFLKGIFGLLMVESSNADLVIADGVVIWLLKCIDSLIGMCGCN